MENVWTYADIDRILTQESKKITFTWYTDTSNRSFAVCEYSGRVAKIATSVLSRFQVVDTLVVPGHWCEESRRCFDVSCPLNKTTKETLAREYRVTISRIPANWRVLSEKLTHELSSKEDRIYQSVKRRPLKVKKRFRILERDGFRCCLCGRTAKETKLHVDHIIPVSIGGSDENENLQTLCQDCNLGKSNKLITPD